MATLTIRSRALSDHIFYVPDSGGYIKLINRADFGQMNQTIYYGGGMIGAPITADAKSFEPAVRAWWRQYVKQCRQK